MTKAIESRFTEAEARSITEELKADYGALQVKIASAWRGRIWLALGYESWQDYLDAEFSGISLRPPKELEEQVINELRQAGMSTRGIASATDLSQPTIHRRIANSGDSNESPETETAGSSGGVSSGVTGLDGKTYASRQSREAEVIEDAEIVEEPSERLVSDAGLTPVEVPLSSSTSVGVQVARMMHDMVAGGSAPLPVARKRSKSVELAIVSGHVNVGDSGVDVEEFVRDLADTVAVLSDLLSTLAEHGDFEAVCTDVDVQGSARKALSNLQVVEEVSHR